MAKAGKDLGFNVEGPDGPRRRTDVLQPARAARPRRSKTVGKETVDGVETTHYRAHDRPEEGAGAPIAIAAARPRRSYKPIDVWVDGDGLVRQVKFDYTTKAYTNQAMRAHVR